MKAGGSPDAIKGSPQITMRRVGFHFISVAPRNEFTLVARGLVPAEFRPAQSFTGSLQKLAKRHGQRESRGEIIDEVSSAENAVRLLAHLQGGHSTVLSSLADGISQLL